MRALIVKVIVVFCLASPHAAKAQEDSILEVETSRLLQWLSSDERRGRVNFTIEQLEAASYIAAYFRDLGLRPFPGLEDYYQRFAPRHGSLPDPLHLQKWLWNRRVLRASQIRSNQDFPVLKPMVLGDFRWLPVSTDRSELNETRSNSDEPLLLWFQSSEDIGNLIPDSTWAILKKRPGLLVLVADPNAPKEFSVKPNPKYIDQVLHNVVAVLPGTTQAEEAVIFSAHYDHIGVDIRNDKRGLYNGANDNASGTTAVMQLARYFAMRGPQPRTLIFACFSGEEMGLLGSSVFAESIHPANIVANINIEMIGMHNATGKNAFFLTGQETSNLMHIMRQNLGKTNMRVDPAPEGNLSLFERSDNFSFYKKGVVAHSVMCSDDGEPCYHNTCDDYKRIDLANLNRVIIAIARSVSSIVQGLEKPVLH